MRSAGLMAVVVAATAYGAEPIRYNLSFDVDRGVAKVRIELPAKETGRQFHMPAWRPGDYFQFDYGQTVRNIRLLDGDEEVEVIATRNPNVFRGAEPFTAVEYEASPSRANFTDNLIVGRDLIFVSGGAVLGWIDDRQNQPVELSAEAPATGLTAVMGFNDPTKKPNFAPNLESLGDLPLVLAKSIQISPFEVGGVKHQFVAFGNLGGYSPEQFVQNGRLAAESALKMFGSLPYKSYTYYAHIGGFPAGLEGAESCRIGLWNARASDAAGLMFHEYMHAFNVKHIRPEPLRPVDLANPPSVSTLWWLEGGTDYLADVLRFRAGLLTKDQLLAEMESAYQSMSRRGGGGYRTTSLTESSLKVWQTRGSQGFGGVSYYTKGKVVSFMLDLAIRRESSGLKSLDDVFRTLYAETGPAKPGYKESRIRELCVEYGGSRLGPLYDILVETADPLPWIEILNRAGFSDKDGKIVTFDQAEPMAKTIASEYPQPVGFSR